MESILYQLSSSVILTRKDIEAIRLAIAEKYTHFSKSARASLLAKAIHETVETALVGIDRQLWQDLKQALFKNTLAKQKLDITKRDVFFEIINLELEPRVLNVSTFHWLLTQEVTDVDTKALDTYINRQMKLTGRLNKPSKYKVELKSEFVPIPFAEIPVGKESVVELPREPEIPPVEVMHPTAATKAFIRRTLEPTPLPYGPMDDWPVAYQLSHLGLAVVGTGLVIGGGVIYSMMPH